RDTAAYRTCTRPGREGVFCQVFPTELGTYFKTVRRYPMGAASRKEAAIASIRSPSRVKGNIPFLAAMIWSWSIACSNWPDL
ncbi:MAG: hypothetical protein ACM3ZC_05650, partial [Bacteroidota bacterium]